MIKVLTAIPVYPHIEPATRNSIENQTFKGWNDILLMTYNIADPKSSRWGTNLAYKQNTARNIVSMLGYTHLFLVESDVIPPWNALETLLASEKDVISGWYMLHSHSGELDGKSSVFIRNSEGRLTSITPVPTAGDEYPGFSSTDMGIGANSPLIKVDFSIMGCTLISRQVLRDITFDTGLDGSFTLNCIKCGYEMFVDSRIYCNHIDRYKKAGE